MRAVPLSTEEQALLPPIRPRWLAHVAALGGCGLSVGVLLAVNRFLSSDLFGTDSDLPLDLRILLLVLIQGIPWVLMAPILFRVGYGWGTVVLLVIFPFAAPIVGWALGFRLVRIPYRDWRPSRRQWSKVRPVPDTGYHVLQADLDRMEPSSHRATS